jgi:hypothetical protein
MQYILVIIVSLKITSAICEQLLYETSGSHGGKDEV